MKNETSIQDYIRDIAQTEKGPIEYTLTGHGPTILKITGMSQDCTDSMGNKPLLVAGFSILTPSRPGYGKTPFSVGKTAAEASNAMVALLDILNIKQVYVIAVSGGGPTAIYLSAHYPDRVRKLILEDAVSRNPKEIDPERYALQKKFYDKGYAFTCLMLKIIATLSPKSIARQTFALFGTHDPNEAVKMLSKSELKEISLFYQKQVGSWAKGALNDMEHFTSESDMRSIQLPTLIIHSREDKAVSFEFAEYSHSLIRGSELWEAPSWSHLIFIGPGSEYVGQKVVAFLKSEF
jgi:pimeloyl-ACP methyl ester carboxylesterase